jgi:hypothetical protein
MLSMVGGLVVLGLTVAAFIYMLPRHGVTHRFVDTEWEPYIGVAFCSATALGLTMTLSGALSAFG